MRNYVKSSDRDRTRRVAGRIALLGVVIGLLGAACGSGQPSSGGGSSSYGDGTNTTWFPDGNLSTGDNWAYDSRTGCSVIVGEGVSC